MNPLPDILLITIDRLRQDAIGSYGNPAAATPHIDALARAGIQFEHCYASSPRADVSRRTLMTGRACAGPEADTLPQLLRKNGYRIVESDTLSNAMAALEVAARAGSEPFAAFLHLGAPADVPRELVDLEAIPAEAVPPPLIIPHALEGRPRAVQRQAAQPLPSRQEQLQRRHRYYCQVHALDEQVGRMLEIMERHGRAETALVVLTGTNGHLLGDHQLPDDEAFFYDPLIDTPLIIRWPGRIADGQRTFALVQHVDTAATLLEASGCHTPGDGRSLLPVAMGEPPRLRQQAIAFDSRESVWGAMIREGNFKLILYHTRGREEDLEGELFDTEHDWHELNSLWQMPEYWGIRLGLTEKLLNWTLLRQRESQ